MSCYHFIVSIYDTSLISSGGPEPLNFSGKNDVSLIYSGGDEKFFNLFNSRLQFSLEVSFNDSLTSLNYEALFTGNEFKYKVVVTNDDNQILWSGFMLPDSYQEPFTTGTFYINFIATDGISKLKGKNFINSMAWRPYQWYSVKHSIIKTIADCLKLTGLNLEIRVDPAIENKGANKRLDKIFISAGVWFDGVDQAENANTILEDVLKEIGCVLFQQDNYWYIIGQNKRSAPFSIFNRYDFNGIYLTDTIQFVNKRKYLHFEASPLITMLPPYKSISIESGVDIGQEIFPEDIVKQPWIKTAEPQDPPDPNFWKANGGPYQGTAFECKLYNEKWEVNNDWPIYSDEDLNLSAVVGANILTALGSSSFYLDHYISLNNPPWIAGGNGQKLDWSFDVVTWWPIPRNHDWINTVNNDIIIFQILIDGVCVASNKPGFTNRSKYYLTNTETPLIENDFSTSKITSSFVFTDFIVPNSGLLDIRIHHPGDAENAGLTGIMQYYNVPNLEIKYYNENDSKYFTQTRNIDFTKTKSMSIIHGDNYLDVVKNNFIIQNIILLSEFTQINGISAGERVEGWSIRINISDYNLLNNNQDKIYFQRNQSDYPEYIKELKLFTVIQPSVTLYYITLKFIDNYKPSLLGKLYIRLNTAGDPQTNSFRTNRQEWQKCINSNGYERLGDVLAKLMHDIYHDPIVTMEGTTKGLIFPLEMLGFSLNNKVRTFLPTRLSLTPGQNSTQITAIEYKNINVNDYEAGENKIVNYV